MKIVGLNSDVGEGVGNEAQLMPLLTSCNIACGAHAGDPETMKNVVALAIKSTVKIGAHPGYADRENFGRMALTLSRKQLKQSITAQIITLKTITENQGGVLHHIKPHGALYNKAAVDKKTAAVIIESIKAVDDNLVLYVPYKSVIQELAKGVLETKAEGFADRNYNTDYTLVSRSQEQALITEPSIVLKHIERMIVQEKLRCLDGTIVPIQLDTLCVHGDTPEALEILKYITKQAKQHQIAFV